MATDHSLAEHRTKQLKKQQHIAQQTPLQLTRFLVDIRHLAPRAGFHNLHIRNNGTGGSELLL